MKEYAIFKMIRRSPDYWDGPFKSKKEALRWWRDVYGSVDRNGKDFRVAEIVTRFLPMNEVRAPKARRGSRR